MAEGSDNTGRGTGDAGASGAKAAPGGWAGAGDVPSWRSGRAWAVLAAVTAAGLITDIASKYAAFRWIAGTPVPVRREDVLSASSLWQLIPPHEPVTMVPRLLDFTLVLNPGAVFGMGAGKRWFFVTFTFVAIAFSLWIFGTWTRSRDRWAQAAVGLVISGGIGNLYDRIVYACVRDFIHPLPGLRLPFGWNWPWGGREVWPYVSNVADLWLLAGIGILIVRTWTAGPPGVMGRGGTEAGRGA